MPFSSQGNGTLPSIYISDYNEIDQYAKTGSLWTWGSNTFGSLGNDNSTDQSSPVQTISGGTNWRSVAGGQYHTAAIKTDGTLWTWGYNFDGQLGTNNTTKRSSPGQTVSGGTDWKLVSCGVDHTVAIKTDGSLWGWGTNFNGQLGDNTITNRSSPVQTISTGTNWRSVSAGDRHTAAIKTDGALWSWGQNINGSLGDGTVVDKSSPVQIVGGGTNWRSVAGGQYHTAAIKTDGTLWTWGFNANGQLGDNTVTKKSSPAQTVGGGTNWKSVECGTSHTAAIKTDGTLWTWGLNVYGALGNNTNSNRSSPVQTISAGTNWKSVACGIQHTAAIKTDGTLWTWGYNNFGQLGDNTVTSRSSPIQTVSGGTNWKLVAAGKSHTAAIYFYDAGNMYPSA